MGVRKDGSHGRERLRMSRGENLMVLDFETLIKIIQGYRHIRIALTSRDLVQDPLFAH